jgi:hypothetical protein
VNQDENGSFEQTGAPEMMFARERRGDPPVDDPRAVVQRGLSAASGPELNAFYPAVHRLVRERDWEHPANTNGSGFASFAELAVAPQPDGLQIWTEPAAKLIRGALLETGHVPPWVELLHVIKRPVGAPRKTFTLSEGFCPFYPIPRSQTALDKLLLQLSSGKYPEAYEDVCAGRRKIREAAIDAGILAPPSPHPRKFELETFKKYPPKVQGKMMGQMFRSAALEGQCFLIASELQPALGMELAQEWRRLQQTQQDRGGT